MALQGDPDLGRRVAPLLSDGEGFDLVSDPTSADLVLFAAPSLMDPSLAPAQEPLLAQARPHIAFGLDFTGNGFVGPYRDGTTLGACLVCLRTRLTANSPDSETRAEYIRHLEDAPGKPLHRSPGPALALALGSWLIQRAGSFSDPQDGAGAALTLIAQDTLTATHHPLLPVPTCPACRDRQSTAERTQVLDLVDAVDSRVGIVHQINVRPARTGPAIHLSGTTSADLRVVRPSMRAANNGGAGFTHADALNSGVGESVERYCAGVYRSEDLQLSSWNDLTAEAVEPERFARLSPEQLAGSPNGFVPFEAATPVRWTPARRWRDGATVLVPASQVYLPYRRVRGEAPIGQSISTGQAAAPTLTGAVLGGLREVIERDALAVSWMHRLPPLGAGTRTPWTGHRRCGGTWPGAPTGTSASTTSAWTTWHTPWWPSWSREPVRTGC